MPTVQRSIAINAPPERVWEAFVELETWPTWNPHMRDVRRLAEGPLAMGTRAQIVLKSRLSSTWEVTEFAAGRSFAWEANLLGSHLLFDHVVEAGDGGSQAILRVDASGPTAFFAGPVLSLFYSRNLDHSLRLLKDRLEEASG
jgi:hypothetical protein